MPDGRGKPKRHARASDLPLDINTPADIRRLARMAKNGVVFAFGEEGAVYKATVDHVTFPQDDARTLEVYGSAIERKMPWDEFLSRQFQPRRQSPVPSLLFEGAYMLTLDWGTDDGWRDDAVTRLGMVIDEE